MHTTFFENTVSSYTFFHCSVNFCGRTKCLGLLERYLNRKCLKNKKQQQHFFLLGVTVSGITQKKSIFNIFQIWSNGRRLLLASSLKNARRRYFLFRKY
jgi:hypothetical protein